MWHETITLLALTATFISANTIDLSHRGLKKEDFFVKIQSQINLLEITNLTLRGNEFDSFLDCSTNLASLRILDLSQNHLQRFFFLCKDEYNLQVLNVSHNKLEYIDDNALNNRIPKLQVLDLSFNKLGIVNETMLAHFKILEFLSLAHNPIGDGIHEGAFWNLKALKHLDLSDVSASYFSPEFFKTLGNLSTLDLSWNPIETVSALPTSLEELDLSGTNILQLENFYLPGLRELRLNNMRLMTSLILNQFENLTSLVILSLDGSKRLNHLKLWSNGLTVLPRLQRLSVKGCALQNLGPELRSIIQRMALLDLGENPWTCDCRMQWLNVINSTKEISREIKCRTPERHVDKLLSEIPNYELRCERPFARWDITRRNRDTVTYTNVVESSNDLVRILAVGETLDRNEE
ncbi:hypothetical protein KM043_000846 [Ampulex compressa]|nr:hypothetical protein KM043_000846 [Ampulex compressa]